ncbi:hypothetical protein KKA47_02485, partial [bacterium]|nr:hypothetical protein [bacterium]
MKNNLVILFLLFFFLSCSADDITQSKPSIEASDEAIFNNSNQEDPESENNPDEENPENPAFNSDENKPPLNEPYIYDHFTTNSGIWDLQKFLPGEIKFEASNVQMQINGDPDLGPYDKVGPGFAN